MFYSTATDKAYELFYSYVEEAKEANSLKQVNGFNGRNQVFNYDLQLGESLEDYVKSFINNELEGYECVKLEYQSDLYEQYNHVDLLVYKNGKPYCCFDCKALMCYMKKSEQFFGIPPQNNIAINYYSLCDYKKNSLPTFVLVYNDTTHPDNQAGFYIQNVKNIHFDDKYILQQNNRNGLGSYKYNLDNRTFKYSSDLKNLLTNEKTKFKKG